MIRVAQGETGRAAANRRYRATLSDDERKAQQRKWDATRRAKLKREAVA